MGRLKIKFDDLTSPGIEGLIPTKILKMGDVLNIKGEVPTSQGRLVYTTRSPVEAILLKQVSDKGLNYSVTDRYAPLDPDSEYTLNFKPDFTAELNCADQTHHKCKTLEEFKDLITSKPDYQKELSKEFAKLDDYEPIKTKVLTDLDHALETKAANVIESSMGLAIVFETMGKKAYLMGAYSGTVFIPIDPHNEDIDFNYYLSSSYTGLSFSLEGDNPLMQKSDRYKLEHFRP